MYVRVLIYLATKNSYRTYIRHTYIVNSNIFIIYDIFASVYDIILIGGSIYDSPRRLVRRVCVEYYFIYTYIIRPCFFKNAAAPNTPMNNANEPVGWRTRFINHTLAVYIYIYIYGRRRVLTAAAGHKFSLIYIYTCGCVCIVFIIF